MTPGLFLTGKNICCLVILPTSALHELARLRI